MDAHREAAAKLFGKPESEVTEEERRAGKVATFPIRFGSSWPPAPIGPTLASLTPEQRRLYDARREARRKKDFMEADRLRRQLEDMGVAVVEIDRAGLGPLR